MIVCICHRVSDRDILREAHAGCASFDELQDLLRVGTACGACRDCAHETFQQAAMSTAARAGMHRVALPVSLSLSLSGSGSRHAAMTAAVPA